MMLRVLVVIATVVIVGSCTDNDRPVVDTANGHIRGTFKTSRKGRQYVAFEGIPYAKPPVGELRFKEPQAQEPWTGIWEAQHEYYCSQMVHVPTNQKNIIGTEDCLYLNVYTPELTSDKKYNVFVQIHGGAFMLGNSDTHSSPHLLDRDIVLVMMNYRLGPLGFLSTEDNVVPGNNGMKDQVLALKWVKENIHQFGGNPDSITITGVSAGGASVHFHLLSPLSKGLFHRAISMSGTALTNWALVEHPLQKARQLGVIVGCDQVTTQDLVQCLRQRSATQLLQAVTHFQPWLYNPYTPFGPSVELAGDNKFLPDLPYNLLQQGHVADVPWITSVTSHEGLYPGADFLFSEDRLPYLEQHWTELAPYILHYDGTVPRAQQADVAAKIKQYYLKGEPISKATFPALVQAIGDRLFVVDAEKAARLQAQVNKSPVYFYRFSYRGGHSLTELFAQNSEDLGVSHGDDFMYITPFSKSLFRKYLESEADNQMVELLLNMWISFGETGTPNVPPITWHPVSPSHEHFQYLHIASPNHIDMERKEYLAHNPFWNALPFQENDLIATIRDEL